jgi:hypothetical protein
MDTDSDLREERQAVVRRLLDAYFGRAAQATMIVRCIENFLQSDVLTEGREYEVLAERDDCYILSGFDKGFSKRRFEIVSQPRSSSAVAPAAA